MQTILVVDDEPIVAEGVAIGLARGGRRMIVCHDLESAELVIENEEVDAIVTDVQFRGEFSFDGLDFVESVKKRIPDLTVVLMTGAGHEGLEREAIRRGAAGLFRKPFPVSELDDMLPAPEEGSSGEEYVSVPQLDEILERRVIPVRFQPVVDLASRDHVGLEALARLETASLFRNPELLFRYASRKERTADLDRHCLERAIRLGSRIPPGNLLLLNIHPDSLEHAPIVHMIRRSLQDAGLDPSRVVLEITAGGAIRTRRSLDQVRALKELGIGFALDDIGSAFSHLPFIGEVEPSWLKISQVFGTDFERNPARNKVVRNIVSLASSFEARFILEGIESEETAIAAIELGIEYGQGFRFGKPAEIDTFL